jgi:glycosyltransferase involved in cell wall biosynthesis
MTKDISNPTLSVLISTFNRRALLPRAVNSVLNQTFSDLELIIIDDCSSDGTQEVVKRIKDPRLIYFRNERNVGSKLGDRAHMRKFIYEMMRGEYFLYLCDDDYLLDHTIFERQITAFKMYKNISMAIGGQLSHFITDEASLFGGTFEKPKTFNMETIRNVFDFVEKKSKTPHMHFMSSERQNKSLFSSYFMTSEEYLNEFASEPTSKNIIVGATMYSRQKFIECGGFADEVGSHWQAGCELLMGPACVGDVVYFNEPSVVTEIRAVNASFQRTQLDHFFDSVVSIEKALQTPITLFKGKPKERFLKKIKAYTLRNLSRAYLSNTYNIKRYGSLGMCSPENISVPVKAIDVFRVLKKNAGLATLRTRDILLIISTLIPQHLFLWLESRINFRHLKIFKLLRKIFD